MLLQLHGVGNHKIAYKDHNTVKFDSLEVYILLAKKAISKFANQFYHGLATKMLKDEDAISSIANAIMMADWRWDENYQNKQGTKKTKYSYRNQCALWSIQTHISKNYKLNRKIKNKIYSLDHILSDTEDLTAHSYTEDRRGASPESIVMEQEQKMELSQLINTLLDLDCLTSRQRDYIKLYYFESYTFEKIGKKYGITREAVRQGLAKAINLIKESINV